MNFNIVLFLFRTKSVLKKRMYPNLMR